LILHGSIIAMALTTKKQYAALPWRQTGAGIEVMLISSRETQRWIIPKGWPIPGLSPQQTAAREAFEEAGVGGMISPKPIGEFEYNKRLEDGKVQRCEVSVYGLEQMIQHPSWPEKGQRKLQWFAVPDAATAVQEPDLAKIIRRLG
jgi:8-oxo-dGTP pyrophosphatase MutT (NUDIX family)